MQRRLTFLMMMMPVSCCFAKESPDANVPDGYRLIFASELDDGLALKQFAFSCPEHWQRVKVGDRYALEHTHCGSKYKPPFRSPHNIALVSGHKFGSFVLDYEVQQTSREYGHRDACVFFNFVDPARFYYVHVATNSDPHAHQVFTVDNAARTAITKQGTKGFDWGPTDKWHRVRIARDVESGTIEVYVDDMSKPIMKAIDTTHGFGYIGFGSFDDSGRVTNIRIYASESQTGRASFFDSK